METENDEKKITENDEKDKKFDWNTSFNERFDIRKRK